MAQDCGAYFAVCRDELRFAESLNCAGLPLGGRSFSRVLLPLRGLQSPLVRAAMPVGQTGLQSRCPGCVNSYHHSAETARLSTITIAAWAKSSAAARKSGAARTAKSGFPLRRWKPHNRSPASASPSRGRRFSLEFGLPQTLRRFLHKLIRGDDGLAIEFSAWEPFRRLIRTLYCRGVLRRGAPLRFGAAAADLRLIRARGGGAKLLCSGIASRSASSQGSIST